MNRFDLKPQASSFAITENISALDASSTTPAGRLMVLVTGELNYGAAIQRIWQLAIASGRYVHLLGLCKNMTQELTLSRQLITMSALLRDSRIPVKTKIEFGTSWIDIIQGNYQAGDIIVCFAEQRYEFLHEPLTQALEENLPLPIFILSGQYTPGSSRRNVRSLFLFWAGSIGVITGAFLLQIRIMSLPPNWAQTPLMILSTISELSLIWVWNNLFS